MANVLIAEDTKSNALLVSTILGYDGHKIASATTSDELLEMAQRNTPDVILLNIDLPDGRSLEICKALKQNPHTSGIPVLFLSGDRKDTLTIAKGLEIGGDDYIVKPFSNMDLQARVSVLVRLHNQFRKLNLQNEKLKETNRELLLAQEELGKMAITDSLTGLHNRRYFVERLSETFSSLDRNPVRISLLYLDLDRFKNINDLHGHQAGDHVLIKFSQILAAAVRKNDIIARIGGEEFAVAILDLSSSNVRLAADRIRQMVEGYRFVFNGKRIAVTVSIGIASYPDIELAEVSLNSLMSEADKALYTSKTNGRNMVSEAPATVSNMKYG